jgi:hypothetical protein
MKKQIYPGIILLLLIVLILASCVNTPVIIKPRVEGKYVRIKENDRAGFLGLGGMIDEVEFGEKVCRFNYFGMSMSGKYFIDKNYLYIETGGELGMLSMEIINSDTLEGEGWIEGTFVKKQ